ncbi:MAG TPA: 50S ribosomal protein L24 [Candidatus Paceibacterota bacterium]|nr:50S ribosomal protein L24 [Candidatus Paceibacterota bacterium]
MKLHVKKGDKVSVLTGKDKGKSGTIIRAYPATGKVLIEGVAVAKRHVRGRAGEVGRIVERPMPIDASNVRKIEK